MNNTSLNKETAGTTIEEIRMDLTNLFAEVENANLLRYFYNLNLNILKEWT